MSVRNRVIRQVLNYPHLFHDACEHDRACMAWKPKHNNSILYIIHIYIFILYILNSYSRNTFIHKFACLYIIKWLLVLRTAQNISSLIANLN